VLIPVSDAAKNKLDALAVGTGAVAYFKAIPWPEIAGALSCLYLTLRIIGWLWDRYKGRATQE
jgi:hypothetical protein